MSRPRIPQSLAAREFEARLMPFNKAKTLATRLPRVEMLAVEEAAKAAGQTCSQWLREAAVAHLKTLRAEPEGNARSNAADGADGIAPAHS